MLRTFPSGTTSGGGGGSVTGYEGTFSASTSWAVNHALNSQKLLVNCWKATEDILIEPDSITINDNDNITIEWGAESVAGKVEVINLA